MFKYTKVIIFILILLLVSGAVVFIDSSIDNMNKSIPDISEGIVSGDSDYNEAVELVNNKYYAESMSKAVSAENNFNKSLNRLYALKDNFTNDVDDVHESYINTTIHEVELKLKAVEKLKESIECFEVNSNYTGTGYASEANDYIYEALQYQNQRDSIVSENPKMFKENFIM